jgi:hypothetical protein
MKQFDFVLFLGLGKLLFTANTRLKKCFLEPRPNGKLSEYWLKTLGLDRPPDTKKQFLDRLFRLERTQ